MKNLKYICYKESDFKIVSKYFEDKKFLILTSDNLHPNPHSYPICITVFPKHYWFGFCDKGFR